MFKGRVAIWDLRQTRQGPVSPWFTDHRHTDHVWKVQWVYSCPNVLLTASEDGSVCLLDRDPSQSTGSYPTVYHGDLEIGEVKIIQDAPTGIHDFVVYENMLITANNDESVSICGIPLVSW